VVRGLTVVLNKTLLRQGWMDIYIRMRMALMMGAKTLQLAISAYIESSQFDIGDGNNFSFVSRIIPDVTFRDSTASSPSVTFTMKARNFPGGNYLQEDDSIVTKTATVPVEQFTNQANIRLRGRSMALACRV
jgi:hypothetical protein